MFYDVISIVLLFFLLISVRICEFLLYLWQFSTNILNFKPVMNINKYFEKKLTKCPGMLIFNKNHHRFPLWKIKITLISQLSWNPYFTTFVHIISKNNTFLYYSLFSVFTALLFSKYTILRTTSRDDERSKTVVKSYHYSYFFF